jgi:hypothetical protein
MSTKDSTGIRKKFMRKRKGSRDAMTMVPVVPIVPTVGF